MSKITKHLISSLLLFVFVISAYAQKDIVMSQYMHNRYALNTAFAGNREVLSMYGTYRKKWLDISGSPSSTLFSMHSPLKNEKVALGLEVYNQQYGVNGQTGFALSYTYRLKMSKERTLAFSINGGGGFYSANWTKVSTFEEGQLDPVYASNESNFAPIIGFGSAWYSNQYFVGFSVPNLFNYDPYLEGGSNSFALDKANYLLTAGYLFDTSDKWHIQPSVMARYNPQLESFVDINATAIYNNMLWLGVGYRSSNDILAMVGYQINQQFRFSYSLDYTMGEISSFNNGTHEIAIQYDFGFKVKTPNPKFF